MDRWMHKEDGWSTLLTVEYYSAIKKEWNNAICSNMDGPRDYGTKWNKSNRERQISYDITYMWSLKYDTNELIYKTGIFHMSHKVKCIPLLKIKFFV